MTDHLHMLAAICGQSGPGVGFLLAMFCAGAAGSVVHCAPMCGPFVLSQVSANLARIGAARLCERHRVSQALLVPYHCGRITTYAALGAVSAGGGAALGVLPFAQWVPGALLLAAAGLFAAQGVRRIFPRGSRTVSRLHPSPVPSHKGRGEGRTPPPLVGGGWGEGWQRHIEESSRVLARRIDRSTWRGGFLLGVVLGFLPCGMLYAAIAAAAGSGSVAAGGAAMAAFGLGTAPGLAAIGIAGHAGGRFFAGRGLSAIGPAVMLLNAGLLTLLAWQRLTGAG